MAVAVTPPFGRLERMSSVDSLLDTDGVRRRARNLRKSNAIVMRRGTESCRCRYFFRRRMSMPIAPDASSNAVDGSGTEVVGVIGSSAGVKSTSNVDCWMMILSLPVVLSLRWIVNAHGFCPVISDRTAALRVQVSVTNVFPAVWCLMFQLTECHHW
jgi:hypothetical protein